MGALKSILYNEECNDNIFFFFTCPLIFSQQVKIFVRNFLTQTSHETSHFSRNILSKIQNFFSHEHSTRALAAPPLEEPIEFLVTLSRAPTQILFIEIDIEKLRIILSSLNTAVHNCERKWRGSHASPSHSAAIQGVEVGNES